MYARQQERGVLITIFRHTTVYKQGSGSSWEGGVQGWAAHLDSNGFTGTQQEGVWISTCAFWGTRQNQASRNNVYTVWPPESDKGSGDAKVTSGSAEEKG